MLASDRTPWHRWRAWCVLLLIVCSGGCTSPRSLPSPFLRLPALPAASPQVASGVFVAGIGKVDITPPPGLPLFGYGRARAADAAGVRTRLYARAFYLEDARGERLALVQCDLGAISALLHVQVARAVVQETGLAVDRLLLSATHTHAGPGGYFGERFSNYWGANRPGYDPRIVAFLAQRIAVAVLTAYRTRAPARLAFGDTTLYGLAHNRSLEAYNSNQSSSTPDESLWTMLPEYLAVDPTLTLLRVDRIVGTKTQPLGAWSNFAMQGAAVAPSNDLYSGDVHAAAERALEWAIQRQYGVADEVIHALTNGAAGDVTPAVPTQDFEAAEQLGLTLGARAFELFQALDTRLTDVVHLDSNYEEVSLRAPYTVDDMAVCQQAMVGVAVLGGSEEGRSALYDPTAGIYEGARRDTPKGCHTWKHQALGALQDLTAATDFPTTLTLQAMRINDLLLLAIPGAVTTEQGRRIKLAALLTAEYTQQGITHGAIVGMANHDVGYFTTPEEYAMQHYEGASTLYGQASGPFIASRFIRLVEQMATPTSRGVPPLQWLFRPGPPIQAFPEARVMHGAREAQPVTVDTTATPPRVSFRWQDLGPGAIQLDQPLVSIEAQERDGRWLPLVLDTIPVNDQGLHLEIRYLQDVPATSAGLWQTTWYPASEVTTPLRFVIAARDTQPVLYSESFRAYPERPPQAPSEGGATHRWREPSPGTRTGRPPQKPLKRPRSQDRTRSSRGTRKAP